MEKIDLNTFAGGALRERVNLDLQELLENIADPNTSSTAARKLTITLTFKANENREVAMVDVQTKPTLVPAKGFGTQFILGKDNRGKVIGAELKSGAKDQTYINEDGEVADDKGKVVNFK